LTGPIGSYAGVVEGSEYLFYLLILDMAVKCGGYIEVVKDKGKLLGAVLFTSSALWKGDELLDPTPADEIRGVVGSWMTTDAALSVVCDVLSSLDLVSSSGSKKKVTVKDINTIGKLCKEINLRQRIKSVPRDLLEAIKHLRFEGNQHKATASNIAYVLRRIASNEFPDYAHVTEDLFTHPNTFIAANLSAFGPSSISFINTGGAPVPIYSVAGDDPNVSKKVKIFVQTPITGKKGKKAFREEEQELPFWHRICISRVSIAQAIVEFDSFLASKKIAQLTVSDAKSYGNIEIHNLSASDELLPALRLFGGKKEDFEERSFKPAFVAGPSKKKMRGAGGLEF
jgi:hypothetical protein